MDNISWLLYANIAVWVGLGLYVAFLGKVQSKLQKRLTLRENIDNV